MDLKSSLFSKCPAGRDDSYTGEKLSCFDLLFGSPSLFAFSPFSIFLLFFSEFLCLSLP